MAASNHTLTPFQLGEQYAKTGLTHNPYLSGNAHYEFQNGYNSYKRRTQYHGEPDRTTRKQ